MYRENMETYRDMEGYVGLGVKASGILGIG